jgi:Pentapeptide repeats (8 copies)
MYFMNKGDESSMVNKLQSLFTNRKKLSRLLFVIVIIGIGVLCIPSLYKYEWSGFGEDSNKSESTEETVKDGKVIGTKITKTKHFQSPKTLWDWLGLGGKIAIPVMIYVFQTGEQRRAAERADAEKEAAAERADAEKEAAAERAKVEREIADANLREEALQAYIDRMAEILIDKDRRLELLPDKDNNRDTNIDNPVRDVVRVRTTTILRRLESDKERQGHVLDFLRDAELLPFILSGANLSRANLSDANLSRANLRDANLRDANLSSANLSSASLSGAYLRGANLWYPDLSGADLGEILTQIKTANNWETARYSDELHSQLGLPPKTP